MKFKLCSKETSSGPRECVQIPTPDSADNDILTDSVVTLPTYKMAIILLQNYEDHADHVIRVVHMPTVRALVKKSYLRVNQGETIPPGQAALLFAIFANGAFFYEPSGSSDIVKTTNDAVRLSKFISKSALDVLDYSRRQTSGTLEDVQASILMSQVIFHLDGYSARSRFLSTVAASIARDLRLHRLDADDSDPSSGNPRQLIEREVKRRVFWWIASNEW